MVALAALLASPAAAHDPPDNEPAANGPTETVVPAEPTPAEPEPAESEPADDGAQTAGSDTTTTTTTPSEDDVESAPPVRELVFPVVGPVTWTDTWGACRGYRCSRSHKGVDIFGAKLAPLVAAADGVITKTRRTALTTAGNTIILEDDDGWRYIYLHLNNDSPGTDDGANPQAWIIPNGLRVGDRVEAGDVIGYLGDSGNAERTPAHLHFEVHQPGVGAINPTASVQAANDEGRVVTTASLASTAEGRAEHAPLIAAWYRALLKRDPTRFELFAWTDRFDVGLADRDDLIADLTMAPSRRHQAGTVVRAYLVALGRLPDLAEIRAGIGLVATGYDEEEMVGHLLDGAEFAQAHGVLDDDAFLELIYVNARGRQPSSGVRRYWANQLARGRERASMAGYFVGSYGLKDKTWHTLEVIQAYRAALDRLPTDDERVEWVAHLDRGGQILDIVVAIDN